MTTSGRDQAVDVSFDVMPPFSFLTESLMLH